MFGPIKKQAATSIRTFGGIVSLLYHGSRQTTDDASQEAALQTLTDNLNQQRFKKPNAPFDPNQLPFGTLGSDVRQPGETEADLQVALGLNPYARYTQLAQTGSVDPQLLADAFEQANGPTQADLDPTLDV